MGAFEVNLILLSWLGLIAFAATMTIKLHKDLREIRDALRECAKK
jgi:hypothetical protein